MSAGERAAPGRAASRRTPLAWYAAISIGAYGGWYLFTASSSSQELLLGAACALFTGLFCATMANRLGLLIKPAPRDLAEGWRLPGYLLTDTITVLKVLVQDLAGVQPQAVFLAAPFEERASDPSRMDRSRARSALAVAYTSATPNLIVLGIDHKQHRMLLHQLSKSNIPVMTRHLGGEGGNTRK